MAPMVHGLEAEFSGRVKFNYLDANDPDTYAFKRALGYHYQYHQQHCCIQLK